MNENWVLNSCISFSWGCIWNPYNSQTRGWYWRKLGHKSTMMAVLYNTLQTMISSQIVYPSYDTKNFVSSNGRCVAHLAGATPNRKCTNCYSTEWKFNNYFKHFHLWWPFLPQQGAWYIDEGLQSTYLLGPWSHGRKRNTKNNFKALSLTILFFSNPSR